MNRRNIEELYEKSKSECIQKIKHFPTCDEYAKKTVVEIVIKEDATMKRGFEEKIKEYIEKGFTVDGATSKSINYIWEKIHTSLKYYGTSDWELGGIISQTQDCIAKGYYPSVCEEMVIFRNRKTNASWYY